MQNKLSNIKFTLFWFGCGSLWLYTMLYIWAIAITDNEREIGGEGMINGHLFMPDRDMRQLLFSLLCILSFLFYDGALREFKNSMFPRLHALKDTRRLFLFLFWMMFLMVQSDYLV